MSLFQTLRSLLALPSHFVVNTSKLKINLMTFNFFHNYFFLYIFHNYLRDLWLMYNKSSISVFLASLIFVNLFYYSTYFFYYSWISLHFLVLFISLTVLFQLTFTFIYSTFSKKNLVLANKRIPNRPLVLG